MGRLRPADLGAGAAGVALLVTLFLPWYAAHAGAVQVQGSVGSARIQEFGPVRDFSAWQAFTVVDILLALTAAVAIALVVITASASGPAKPVAFTVIATVTSAIAVLLVLWRLVDAPADRLAVRYGVWVGLGAALLMLVASWAALHDEHTPGAVPPDVPRRPAPPA